MKGTAGKAKAWFTGAKLTKVFTRLGDDIGSQFHDDTSSRLASNGHVKVALGIGHDDDINKVLGGARGIFFLISSK
jgi:hypothetical protein